MTRNIRYLPTRFVIEPELKNKVEGEDLENKNEPVVEEVKPTVQKDPNPLCNLKFDFAKLMGDF